MGGKFRPVTPAGAEFLTGIQFLSVLGRLRHLPWARLEINFQAFVNYPR